MIALAVSFALAALGPETSSALARGVAVAAAEDARFDVVSAFDLDELADAPAGCEDDGTAAAEACVTRLASAYEARLVFFLRVYEVTGETHAALTLADVHGGGIVARHDLVGDDKALFSDVQARARASLAAFAASSGQPSSARTRVFVSEPAVQSTALQRAELEARVAQLNDELAVQTALFTGALGLTLGTFAPAFGLHYASRLGYADGRIAGLAALGALATVIPLVMFVVNPIEADMRQLENRRDAAAFELGALQAEAE